MKHLKLFFALFAMLALGVGNVWAETIFSDNFANVGNGSNTEIKTRDGWSGFSKCYAQGNSGLRLGSSNAGGSITKTAMSSISGTKDIKVTIYTSRYNTNANTFTISCVNGTISSITGVGTLSSGEVTISPSANAGVTSTTAGATWTDDFKTEMIISASSSTTITFATNKRAILGPVTIEEVSSGGGDEPETPTPSVSVAPTSHTFATTNVGETATQEFTITAENTTATLSVSIDNTTDFAISAITGDKVTVTYQPQSAGDHTATMTVKAGEEASTTVALTGKAKTPLAPIAGGVIDILNQAWTGKKNSTYGDVAAKTAENEGHSNAQYVAQCAGDKSSIQLRSNNNNSGVVSTISGGIVKRVEVEWQNETAAGRVLQVYGSNTAYEAATDLYSDDKKGELLGEITMGGDETVVDYSQWTGDYKYIGLRSKSGAMYLTTITITWLPINSKVTIDDAIQNGSISVSGAADLNAVAAGTMLTLDNTSDAGYKFVKYNVYKTGEPTTEIDVENSKFTMPEYDVTVSATFTSIKELDKIEVNTTNVKKTFWQGEAFNSNGLEVTAYYTDGTSAEVKPTNITGGNTENAGEITVTVSYTEGSNTKTTTYNIIVKAIENNETTVYTVAQAREIIDAVGNTTVEVYVRGIVSKIVTAFNPTYGNISYDISADGSKTSDQLQAYRGFSYNGDWFTSVDDIQVGDVVVVKGKLKIYNTTYELDEGNQLVKLERSDEPKPTAASLPFEFDGGRDAIATTLGMSQDGLDADYGSSPKLKFNTTGDYVIVHFDSEPGKLSYDIKGNSFEGGTFSVQQSADGSTYTDVAVYTTFDGLSKENDLLSTSRYVKFIYTNKSAGNVALGNIKIALPSEEPEQPGGGETPGERLTEWVLTPLADITTNDLVVITMTKEETTWAMTNDEGTSAPPVASPVTLSADALASEPAENLKWVVSNDNGTLTIYPYGGYEKWLYSTTSNNGIRVGKSENKTFKIDDTYGYLFNIATGRYVGVYNNADWRSYTSMHANISDQTLKFFVKKNANDILPGTGEDPEEPGDDPVVPTPTINPTATFVFNTAEGLNDLGITYPATDGGNGALMTEFENNASFTQYGITMTTTNGTNAIRAWLSATQKLDLRVYKGATLTFSVPAEHQISKIVFDGSNIGHLLVNETAVSGNAWTGSAKTITFTAKSDASTIKINTIAFVVEYTRNVTNKYGSICLPYASASTSGAYFYEVVGKGTENSKPAVYLASVNTLKAGVPYIFEKTANTIKVVYSSEKEDTPQNANGLIGNFTNEYVVPANNYILYNNAFIPADGTTNKVNAYRAYLNLSAVEGGKPNQMPGRRYIGMDVQGENVETGVEDLFTTDAPVKVIENGQLIIIRDGVKYNVQGQKL